MDSVTRAMGILTLAAILAGTIGYYVMAPASTATSAAAPQGDQTRARPDNTGIAR